jgi:Ca2+/H+ antiporter
VTLSLVLPNFTTAVAGPVFSPSQLVFAGAASLVLYGVFIFVSGRAARVTISCRTKKLEWQ